jgi:hypothetical protein
VQDGFEDQFLYHDVYTDGHFVFDPRLSAEPIPIDAWRQGILDTNPGANITSRTP